MEAETPTFALRLRSFLTFQCMQYGAHGSQIMHACLQAVSHSPADPSGQKQTVISHVMRQQMRRLAEREECTTLPSFQKTLQECQQDAT